MLQNSWNGGSEKTASQKNTSSAADAEMEKLSTELGLFGDFNPTQTGTQTENNQQVQEGEGMNKVANLIDAAEVNLYDQMFPDDSFLNEEKLAGEENDMEEMLGRATQDAFQYRFGSRMLKLAYEVKNAADSLTEDSTPEQSLPNDRPNTNESIDTNPTIMNILPPQTGAHVIGQESNAVSAETKTASLNLAFRKHLFLSHQ
jgi:hypothetical protein